MAEEHIPGNVVVCSFLMAIAMLVAYITKKYHFIYLPESSSAMLLGMIFGALSLVLKMDLQFSFSPEIFFYGLLPIIIFNAGYALKKKDFFRNFSTVILFAVVGTIISSLVYGLCTYFLHQMGIIKHMSSASPLLESLMFGSLISAIDPVATLSIFQDVQAPSLLYNLVFGESLVNDASAIVLFRTFESFMESEFSLSTIGVAIMWFCAISVGSIALGVAVSLLCALVLKYIDIRSEFSKFELAFILLSAYMSYSVAEIMSLSGIMSLFFCGICNAHYGYYSTSHASKISSKYAFEALSFLSELFVFAYLGMQVVVLHHVVDLGLLLSAIPLCLVSRAVNIFPLSWLANRTRTKKITTNMKIMMWLSGLRGAIAYALAVNMPTGNRAIETTTLFVVVFTTLFLGGGTGPMLSYLGLVPKQGGTVTESGLDVPLVGGQSLFEVLDRYEGWGAPSGFHRWFKWIDQAYMKPIFGGQTDRGLVDNGGFSEEDELLSEDKAAHNQYIGFGFALSVPADWTESPDVAIGDGVLVTFFCPAKDNGEIPANVMVTLHPSDKDDVEDYKDPMDFLTDQWEELKVIPQDLLLQEKVLGHIDSKPGASKRPIGRLGSGRFSSKSIKYLPPKVDEIGEAEHDTEGLAREVSEKRGSGFFPRSSSVGSLRASSSSDPAGLNFNPSRSLSSGRHLFDKGEVVDSEHDSEGQAQGSFPPQQVAVRQTQSETSDNGRSSTLTKTGIHLVPAFVMWADGKEDPGGRVYYQYEIVVHPDEWGLQRAQVLHILLSVSGRRGALYVCRIQAMESWWYDGGFRVAKRILDSFRVGDQESQ